VGVRIEPLRDTVIGNAGRALWTLLAAVALVLLIACANVANLLLARASARQKEMAVRAALGAGRLRIVRQLLTESLLLSLAGAAVGVLLAHWGSGAILALSGDAIPRSTEIRLDAGVLIFTSVIAVLTGVLFGFAPALQLSGPAVSEALKDAARATSSGRGRLRQGLMVAEVALTLPLVVGAGLLLRSFHHLQGVNPGFTNEQVLTFRLNLPPQKYATPDQQARRTRMS
jgi:predicted lysophospholipase L1 biosynthesis ABC-type transport system permease subunit